MKIQSLPHREVFTLHIGFDFTNVRRRRFRGIIEQDLQNVLAAFHRLGSIAVAAPLMNGCHRHKSSAM